MLQTDKHQSWVAGPAAPQAPTNCVDVWRIPLNPPDSALIRLENWLTRDERQRAWRFRFPEHQRQFTAAHGCLREILSRYLRVTPDRLEFETGSYGKPYLAGELAADGLTFNLSHSNEIGLVAVSQKRAIGVDIEFIRADLVDEQVARRFFSDREVTEYLALPVEQRKDAFFTCWTRKEAYIKALGEGLSMPLNQFDVSIKPEEPAELLQTRPDPAQALQWRLYALYPGQGYVATLAVEGQPDSLYCWQWSESVPK